MYCVGSCACKDCFNKPEYEETVLNTRQQIESRNPLAFAPKIVQGAESSPILGVSDTFPNAMYRLAEMPYIHFEFGHVLSSHLAI